MHAYTHTNTHKQPSSIWALLVKKLEAFLIRSESWSWRMCVWCIREVFLAGSTPFCNSDGWGACQRLLPISWKKLLATEIIAFSRLLLFQIWNSGLIPFWPLSSLLLLEHARQTSTKGSVHWLIPKGMHFPQPSSWLTPSFPSSLCLNTI